LLLLDLELGFAARVKVAERDVQSGLSVWAASLAVAVAKVSASAEEAREEVEWVVRRCAALLMLFHAVVAVLVVYFPCLWCG
jgi:hypothetical protein